MIATIAIASTLALGSLNLLVPGASEGDARAALMFLPLALASTGLIASIIGIGIVRSFSNANPAVALRIGMIGTPILFIAAAYVLMGNLGVSNNIWLSVLFGAAGGVGIGLITEYYTPLRQLCASPNLERPDPPLS